MDYLLYRSTALVSPGSLECQNIVSASRRNNCEHGLTGFLHAENGLFVQYLEGSPTPLWTLYDRLHLDRRHSDLILLGSGTVSKPRFSAWSMGYSSINVLSFKDFLEEVSFRKPPQDASCAEALTFLMAARIRVDLGISERL